LLDPPRHLGGADWAEQPRQMSRSTSVARRRNVTRNRLYIED
jgi:hypothetical protein